MGRPLFLIVLGALCLSTAQAVTTIRHAFSYSDEDGDKTTKPQLLSSYYPTYDLGILEAGYTLQVFINLPNAPRTNFIFNTLNNNGMRLYYLDNSNPSDIKYKPAVTNAAGTAFRFPINNLGEITYTAKYTVTFPSSYSPTTSKFLLQFIVGNPFFGTPQFISFHVYMSLQVDYYKVGPASPTQTLLKVTEVGRPAVFKIIYVAPNSPPLKFSFFPFYADTATPGSQKAKGDFEPTLYQSEITTFDRLLTYNRPTTKKSFIFKYVNKGRSSGKPFDLKKTVQQQRFVDSAGAVPFAFSGKVANWEIQLDEGFYVLEHAYTGGGDGLKTLNAWFTYQTYDYPCPYSPAFPDYNSNYQGCTVANASENTNCAIVDKATKACARCHLGYALTNGTCMMSNSCPPRQYFHFGQCFPASQSCGDFDKFTGACLNCSDPANYDLSGESCIRKSVLCAPNQYQLNYTCYNASATCGSFDSNSGRCLTCVSELYQLSTDGTCTIIIVECPQGQYAVGLKCVTIPVECVDFDTVEQKCLACIQGHYIEGGVCRRVLCPQGQVPSKYGIFCVSVSSLCATYNSLTGACLSCKESSLSVKDGRCVQISSHLAGCRERERLGFGPCVGADIDCHTFNLQTGNCDQCKQGFYLDYTGHCVRSNPCGARQYSVNGECLGFPQNCLSVDSLGLCASCVSQEYRLQQGQCVFFRRCSGQQYLNAGGQCADVDASCGMWNPSNGQCISCKDPEVSPVSGVCCPLGQTYSGNRCVDSNALQQSFSSATGPSCLVPHPSMNVCLRCSPQYAPDYSIPFGCSRQ